MTEEHDTYPEGAFGWAVSRPDVTNYAYRCYAFVEDAYELSSNIVLDGQGTSAAEAAEAYGARDYRDEPPQRGAYVFYDCCGAIRGDHRNWGAVEDIHG